MPAKVDRRFQIGMKFNRLTILDFFYKRMKTYNKPFFTCKCDCGKEIEATCFDVLHGKHKSCGCLQIESVTKHGHSSFDPKKTSPTYRSWISLKQRCNNPKSNRYGRYGGRGISYCARWEKFENFLSDMGERPSLKHSIDRIDNDGNYEPSNCRWATIYEQARNQTHNPRWQHRQRDKLGRFV